MLLRLYVKNLGLDLWSRKTSQGYKIFDSYYNEVWIFVIKNKIYEQNKVINVINRSQKLLIFFFLVSTIHSLVSYERTVYKY